MGCSKINYKPGIFIYLVVLSATFFHASNELAYAKDSNVTSIPDSGKIIWFLLEKWNTTYYKPFPLKYMLKIELDLLNFLLNAIFCNISCIALQ